MNRSRDQMYGLAHNNSFSKSILVFLLVQQPRAQTPMKIRAIFGWFVWLTVMAGGSPAPAAAAIGDYPFRLVNREAGMGREAVAENGGPAPITVNVTVIGENLAADRAWPITAVVPPYTTLGLGRVYARDRTADRIVCEFHYSYHFGRHEAVPDP